MNRLLTAGDKTHWFNSYAYDAWGNLYQKNKGTLPGGEYMQKAADATNRLSGMTYDAAGNVTADDQGNTMVYDAENRVISVTNSLSGTTTYVYDALGRRIKKANGSTATNYWFGPGGETAAETDATATSWTDYIFFGGQRLARNVSGDIKYYVTDHLHSTAMFVDKSGTVLDDNDFYPWGGVVPGIGTTTSNNHYKFTGKERDAESGLDYFGARYYANTSGRFMSPDWAGAPTTVPYAEFGDPQSLNLYSYVRNSPIVRVDADGHSYAGMNGLNRDESAGTPMATWSNIDEDMKYMPSDDYTPFPVTVAGDTLVVNPNVEPAKSKPTKQTSQCTCQEMSKRVENTRKFGPVGWLLGLFIRHLWEYVVIDGQEHDIAGHKVGRNLQATDDRPGVGGPGHETSDGKPRFDDDKARSKPIGRPSHDCAQATALLRWQQSFQPRPYHGFPGPNSNGAHRDALHTAHMSSTPHFPFFGTQSPGWFYGRGKP